MTATISLEDSVFAWSGVKYGVGTGPKTKQILHDGTGELIGGEVCAILGPSGSGKTSLLNILAGRIRDKGQLCRVEGIIQLQGQPIIAAELRKRIAYVMQEDLLQPTQTPREALLFSAMMRLPVTVSLPDKRELVETMLNDLDLSRCADTFCGDGQLIRGISGGEKKRTSIGVELVVHPKLVFLDEPTSGLDSYAAHTVISKVPHGRSNSEPQPASSRAAIVPTVPSPTAQLRSIAKTTQCNVLCTIHQPSSEAFHTFNKTLLMRAGKQVFFGSIERLSAELTAHGVGCKAEYNLADHAIWLIQAKSDLASRDLASAASYSIRYHLGPFDPAHLIQSPPTSLLPTPVRSFPLPSDAIPS